jgi:hypothetical protein
MLGKKTWRELIRMSAKARKFDHYGMTVVAVTNDKVEVAFVDWPK